MEDTLVQAINIRAEGIGIHVSRHFGMLLDPGVHHVQMGQKLSLCKGGGYHSAVLHRTVMGQDHVCQKRNTLPGHALYFRRLQKKQDTKHRMADELALTAVVRDQPVLRQLELTELADVVEKYTGQKEIPVNVRVLEDNGICRRKHGDSMHKPAVHKAVVNALGGRGLRISGL